MARAIVWPAISDVKTLAHNVTAAAFLLEFWLVPRQTWELGLQVF